MENPETLIKIAETKNNQAGFSLVEVIIAFLVLTISLIGVLFAVTFAINYNTGNSLRAQMQAISQQQIEVLKSARFNPILTDESLTGGTKTPFSIITADGNKFRVEITVDDDVETSGIQINSAKTLKEISVKVTPETATANWQSAPLIVVFRRARGN